MRNKIYYNLGESTYQLEIEGLKFVFSSLFYLKKFENSYSQYLDNHISKLISHYRVGFSDDLKCIFRRYLLKSLYLKIEKRGYLIEEVGAQNENDEVRGGEVKRCDKAV